MKKTCQTQPSVATHGEEMHEQIILFAIQRIFGCGFGGFDHQKPPVDNLNAFVYAISHHELQ